MSVSESYLFQCWIEYSNKYYVFQIKEEGFLEDVNNMLNSGEVPNIFGADEKAELCEKMRVVCINRYSS